MQDEHHDPPPPKDCKGEKQHAGPKGSKAAKKTPAGGTAAMKNIPAIGIKPSSSNTTGLRCTARTSQKRNDSLTTVYIFLLTAHL